jgi:hypothetical protein
LLTGYIVESEIPSFINYASSRSQHHIYASPLVTRTRDHETKASSCESHTESSSTAIEAEAVSSRNHSHAVINAAFGKVPVSDNVSVGLVASSKPGFTQRVEGENPCLHSQTMTRRAKDAAGNAEKKFRQTVTFVVDKSGPVIDDCPAKYGPLVLGSTVSPVSLLAYDEYDASLKTATPALTLLDMTLLSKKHTTRYTAAVDSAGNSQKSVFS